MQKPRPDVGHHLLVEPFPAGAFISVFYSFLFCASGSGHGFHLIANSIVDKCRDFGRVNSQYKSELAEQDAFRFLEDPLICAVEFLSCTNFLCGFIPESFDQPYHLVMVKS